MDESFTSRSTLHLQNYNLPAHKIQTLYVRKNTASILSRLVAPRHYGPENEQNTVSAEVFVGYFVSEEVGHPPPPSTQA